jgi:hypothetical protein
MLQTKFIYWIVWILVLILGGGCATLSKQECLTGNWYGIGYQDGTKGHGHIRLLNHKKACAEYRVLPDEIAYHRGLDEGLAVYCTEQNGYGMGSDVDKYKGACPPELERMFLQGYLRGLDVADYDLHWETSQKSRELAASALKLQDLKGKEYDKQVKKIKRLENQLSRMEDKLHDIRQLRRQYGWDAR